jgi:hypothetical protein
MYNNWIEDKKDEAELAKNHAYLLASFWYPDVVKQLMGEGKHISTDEEFEESSKLVKEMNRKYEEQNMKKRHRRRNKK